MSSVIRSEIRAFFTALEFFTRLPVPAWVGYSQAQLNHAARYFPLVGLIVGAIGGAVTVAAATLLPASLAILIGMAATLLVTGAFHEDGLADACDGFGGGWEKLQILSIMKDSRIGSYGALAVGMALLLKFNALTEIDALVTPPTLALVLAAAHAASRLGPVLLMRVLDYVREDESAKSKPLAKSIDNGGLVLAISFGLIPCLWLTPEAILFAVGGVLLTSLCCGAYFLRRIGGYTGDCLGATQQLAEIAFYLGLLCAFI